MRENTVPDKADRGEGTRGERRGEDTEYPLGGGADSRKDSKGGQIVRKTGMRQRTGKPTQQEEGQGTQHYAVRRQTVGKEADKKPQRTAVLAVEQIPRSQHKQKPQPGSPRRKRRQTQTRQNAFQRKQNTGQDKPRRNAPEPVQRVGGNPAAARSALAA